MNSRIYGFLLNDDILFDLANKKILYYRLDNSDIQMSFKVVTLSDTQARLLMFLLVNRKRKIIEKTDILKSVWDTVNLSSSSQRLWQTMNDIRKKLSALGMPDTFIQNVYGTGYCVDDSKVMSLHIR